MWVRSLNEENVYSLDRGGGAKLFGESPSIPRTLDGTLDHLLGINQVRIACALALPVLGGELVCWCSDWELRAELRTRVIPDALFEVRWSHSVFQRFALEVDRHSRSTRGFLKKLIGYAGGSRSAAANASDSLILFIGHHPNWIDRYRQALIHSRLTPPVWFTTFALPEGRGLAEPVFASAMTNDRYSLRDLSTLPYGKEGISANSLDATVS